MHSTATRNEFVKLRVQGLSFATIGRRLGVSKPTLIAWSRRSRTELDSALSETRRQLAHDAATCAELDLASLTRKLNALKQELLSRSLREIPTAHLETLAGELRQRLEKLGTLASVPSAANCRPSASGPAPSTLNHPPSTCCRTKSD